MFSQQFYFSLSLIMCVEDVGKSSETVSAQLSGNWKPWVFDGAAAADALRKAGNVEGAVELLTS